MDLERRLAHAMIGAHPQDATVVLEGIPLEEAAEILARARPSSAAQILEWAAPHFAASVLDTLDPSSAGPLLELLSPEVAAGLLRRIEEPKRSRMLEAASPKCARGLAPLLRFPPGTAGSLMDPRALGLPGDLTVREATRRLRQDARGVLFNVYVLDRSDVLVGVVSLRDLLSAEPDRHLETIMSPASGIPAETDRAVVIRHPGWQELHSLPVVDKRGVFLGAIRYRTRQQIEREASRRAQAPGASTAQALGDLFAAGVGGVLGAMASALGTPTPEEPDQRGSPEAPSR